MDDIRYYGVDFLGVRYEFVFRYQHTSEGYRAYILSSPGYRSRSTNLSATHRLTDGGEYYVCWSQPIRKESEMDAVVALWCKATVMYIVLGGPSLDQHAKRLMNA